jgi:precorrin-6B methylase 1
MASQVGTGTPSIPSVVGAGAGLCRVRYSFLMPEATGRISHARILAGYRSPAQAELFHNLIKESEG